VPLGRGKHSLFFPPKEEGISGKVPRGEGFDLDRWERKSRRGRDRETGVYQRGVDRDRRRRFRRKRRGVGSSQKEKGNEFDRRGTSSRGKGKGGPRSHSDEIFPSLEKRPRGASRRSRPRKKGGRFTGEKKGRGGNYTTQRPSLFGIGKSPWTTEDPRRVRRVWGGLGLSPRRKRETGPEGVFEGKYTLGGERHSRYLSR